MSSGSSSSNGGFGTPSNGGLGKGPCYSSDELCNCLDEALTPIEEALYAINETLQQKQKKSCDDVLECIDEIEKALKERWERPQASCQECEAMVAEGMAGTIEYAIACAGVVCKEVAHECSMGDPESWGKPCTGCNQEPCCCNQGICEPCETQPQKPKKYQGWCDRQSGLAYVTKEGEAAPSEFAQPVSLLDDETAALLEAEEYCKSGGKPILPYSPMFAPQSYINAPFCDLGAYANQTVLDIIGSSGANLAIAGGLQQVAGAVSDIGIFGATVGDIGSIISGVWSAASAQAPLAAQYLVPIIADALGCYNGQFIEVAKTMASFGLVNKATGIDLSEFTLPYRYAMHSACRNRFLEPDKAIAAYFGNQISYEQLDTHWAVAGYCKEALQWYSNAARSKPIPLELRTMRMRGLITEDEYNNRMRQLGYIEQPVVDDLFSLGQQLPTLTDIIRFMVRDADDDALVAKFGLDDKFTDKYQQQLKTWSEQQGVPLKVAQYAWRSHWQIPSPTQLFEFWRRNRKKPQFGGQDKVEQDIRDALIQQDILPYWHDHYFAINYVPLGRIDIRRAYEIGQLQDADLIPAYNQLGYSDDDAAKLAEFTRRLRQASLINHRFVKMWLNLSITRQDAANRLTGAGYPNQLVQDTLNDVQHHFISSPYATAFTRGDISAATLVNKLVVIGVDQQVAQNIATQLGLKLVNHPSLKDYIVGTKDKQTAQNEMVQFGMDQDVAERLLAEADQNIQHAFSLACQRGVRKRYLLGELDDISAKNELTNRGVTQMRANQLVDNWQCERGAFSRAVTTNKLCDWLGRGVITGADFAQRLQRLGYSNDDAGRILNDCLISQNAKLLQQAKKQADEQAKLDARSARALQRAEAQEIQAVAKLQRARNQAAKTTDRRQRAFMSAAQKMSAKCTCSVYDSLQHVKAEAARVQSQWGLTIDESIQVLITAIEEWQGGNQDTLTPMVDANASTIAASSLTPSIDPVTGVVITSGDTQPS